MRKRRFFETSLIASIVLLCASPERMCEAFNESTHRRIVESAAAINDNSAAVPGPAGIDTAQWSRFLARLAATNSRLGHMRAGLTGAYRGADDRDRMNVEAVPERPLVFINNGNTATTKNDPGICHYEKSDELGREFNLLNVGRVAIQDLPYYPHDQYQPCAYEDYPLRNGTPVLQPTSADKIGAVLGWHSASIDKRTDDQVLWSRPTNSFLANGGLPEALSRGFEYALGALLVPIVCFKDLFETRASASCDAFDLARKINPIEYLEGLVPGIPYNFRTDQIGGMWHFIDIESQNNRYNDHRGLFYEGAGPGHPGIIDVAIMAAGDIMGISLNPFESAGIKHYGRFDRVRRTGIQWQAHPIGHTEFSPVSHLASDGWQSYGGADAAPLGFPLHALGDAAAPHHVVGTSSWGHRPFEDGVAYLEDNLLPRTSSTTFTAMRDRVLAMAFNALKGLDIDSNIEKMVEEEARTSRGIARDNSDWIFKDYDSEAYFGVLASKTAAIDDYRNFPEKLRPFVELSVAYTVAFLVKAGERASSVPLPVDPATRCPLGQHFTGYEPGCAATPHVRPTTNPPPGVTSASCGAAGAVCQRSSDCCDAVPCEGVNASQQGTCGQANPPPPPPVNCDLDPPCGAGGVCEGQAMCVGGCCRSNVH